MCDAVRGCSRGGPSHRAVLLEGDVGGLVAGSPQAGTVCAMSRFVPARVVVTAVAALLFAVSCSGGGESPSEESSATSATVSVPSEAPGPQLVTKRPEEPVEQVAAEGECKVALDVVREAIEKYPSGLVLGQSPALAAEVNGAVAAAHSACDEDTFSQFNHVEYRPWLTYEVPEGYELPAG